MLNISVYLKIKSIFHRDIKHDNILVTAEEGTGRLLYKLADFGEGKTKNELEKSTL